MSASHTKSWIVSPSDHIQLGDAPFAGSTWKGIGLLSSRASRPRRMDAYVFSLTRRHSGYSSMAFSDGHVERGTLRDWTLPVEEVHRRWHYGSKAHLDRLTYRDADNWALLRGIDKEIQADD